MLVACTLAHAVSLEEAWAAAEANSLDLRLVHENTVQTETLKGQAAALVSPKLVLGGHYTYNEYEIAWDMSEMIPEDFREFFGDQEPIVFQKQSYFDGNVSIVQPIFSGQAIPALVGATATIRAERIAEAGIQGRVRAGVAKAYYGLAVAREGEAVARSAAENAKKHVEIVGRQLAAGVAPPTARLQAEIGLSRAERAVASARLQVATAEEAFAKITGLAKDSPVQLPTHAALPFASLEAALDRVGAHRPELRAAEQRVKAARAMDTAGTLSWFPTLDGRFTYSWTENNVGFNDDPTFWQIVLTADWVLWDGGFRLANGQKYASQRRQAELAVDKARVDATEEIRVLWETHEHSRQSLQTAEHEAALAEENLRIAEVAFEAGSISFLDLEDARLGLTAARMSVLAERMNRDLAVYDLRAATGDL